MKKNIIWVLIVVVLLIAGFYFYNKPQQDSLGETIKVGVLSILSGDGAAWGENAKMGIDLAVEEINSNGGINNRNIELIYENTGGEAKNAVSAFRKLVEIEKIDVVVGPLFQQEVAAIAPIANELNIPVITPSYAPIENRSNPRNPLMIWMNPTEEANRMAEFVFSEGIRRIATIGTQDSWESEVTKAFNDKIIELGGEIVFTDLLQTDSTDSRTIILKATQNDPEAFYFGTYYQFTNLVRQVKELGYTKPLYGIEVDSYLVGETQPFSNGLKFIAPEFYNESFSDKFESRYGQRPGIPTGQAYDSIYILANLLQDSNSKTDLINKMNEFESYSGVSGEITVTEDNKTILPTSIFEIKNGEILKIN